MRHLDAMTRIPGKADQIAPEVKLAFIRDVIDVSIPLFENKDPSNPLPTSGS